ncbi:MAG: glycosyltransferase, partial [bacterium]
EIQAQGAITVSRPRVIVLADTPNWAFDYVARSIAARLKGRFDISVEYTSMRPRLDPDKIDLLHVMFWGNRHYKRFGFESKKVIKEVVSWRWRTGYRGEQLAPEEFCRRYLGDCLLVTTQARTIYDSLRRYRDEVYLCDNGFEPAIFTSAHSDYVRRERLRIGWVGNPEDQTKGLFNILLPATDGAYDFAYTDGSLSRRQVRGFYENLDVLTIASIAESQPLPLIESMAMGCFPVTTNVGIVSDLVRHGFNGLIVERSVGAFKDALNWCDVHREHLYRARQFNIDLMKATRSWDICVERFSEIYEYALGEQSHQLGRKPVAVPPLSPFQMALQTSEGEEALDELSASVRQTAQMQLQGLECSRLSRNKWFLSDKAISVRADLRQKSTMFKRNLVKLPSKLHV